MGGEDKDDALAGSQNRTKAPNIMVIAGNQSQERKIHSFGIATVPDGTERDGYRPAELGGDLSRQVATGLTAPAKSMEQQNGQQVGQAIARPVYAGSAPIADAGSSLVNEPSAPLRRSLDVAQGKTARFFRGTRRKALALYGAAAVIAGLSGAAILSSLTLLQYGLGLLASFDCAEIMPVSASGQAWAVQAAFGSCLGIISFLCSCLMVAHVCAPGVLDGIDPHTVAFRGTRKLNSYLRAPVTAMLFGVSAIILVIIGEELLAIWCMLGAFIAAACFARRFVPGSRQRLVVVRNPANPKENRIVLRQGVLSDGIELYYGGQVRSVNYRQSLCDRLTGNSRIELMLKDDIHGDYHLLSLISPANPVTTMAVADLIARIVREGVMTTNGR